jgi:hypothetical protein
MEALVLTNFQCCDLSALNYTDLPDGRYFLKQRVYDENIPPIVCNEIIAKTATHHVILVKWTK